MMARECSVFRSGYEESAIDEKERGSWEEEGDSVSEYEEIWYKRIK